MNPTATPAQGPTFPLTDAWLRSQLERGYGCFPHAARYDFGGFVEFVCPWTGEVLTNERTNRGVRRALNRLHAEALDRGGPPPERPAEVDALRIVSGTVTGRFVTRNRRNLAR